MVDATNLFEYLMELQDVDMRQIQLVEKVSNSESLQDESVTIYNFDRSWAIKRTHTHKMS